MKEKEPLFQFDFMEEVQKSGDRLGLESVTNLFSQLQNIQEQMPVVQIVGTNGKGSVCCFLSSILQEAGFKV
ncbi:MAG: bifunctional folylpolyglutamate synthase/dihydrofolate synthase, partial [Lachnospiraceae bacterium]|nr:bifunctional folylpolyglutamate synthase/dihydrofolate synthase [Lachnospiraceae bacterium]